MPVPRDKFFAAVDLKPAQARMLLRFARVDDIGESLNRHQAGLLLLGDLLIRGGMTLEHTAAVLCEISPDIQLYLEADEMTDYWGLQILDGTYAVWPKSRPFNFQEGAFTETVPTPVIHSTAIALTGLVLRILNPLEQEAAQAA